jgi:D-arabinose 1-dehydrogenase-like Zn-dependent alcohol dehydrogenase
LKLELLEANKLSRYLPFLAAGAKIFPLTISMDDLHMTPLQLVMGGLRVIGSGGAAFSSGQAMLSFAAKHGIKPQVEQFPMTEAGITEALQKLRDGKMRYRGVVVAQ